MKIIHTIIITIVFFLTTQAQNTYSLNIVTTTCSAHFIVKDPSGHRKGVDPRNCVDPEAGNRFDEITDAFYSSETPGDNPNDTTGEIPCEEINRAFYYTFDSPKNYGNYEITIYGIEHGSISLFVDVYSGGNTSKKIFSRNEKIIVDSNSVCKYIFKLSKRSGCALTRRSS